MTFKIKIPVLKLSLLAALVAVALVSTAQSASDEGTPNLIVQEGIGGSTTYARSGNEFELTAMPNAGYVFDRWQCISSLPCLDELESNTASEVSFVSTADVAVRAEFMAEGSPTLTVTDTDNGMVVTSCAPNCSGEPGWLAQVRAIPNAGFTFSEWVCEGGSDCSRVARTDAELFLRVSHDITLTPRYTEISDTVVEVRSAEGSNVSVVVECGTDCIAGNGWTAYLNPEVDAGYALSGWQCESGGSCPSELANSESVPIRLPVTERHVIKPDVVQFQIVSGRFLDYDDLSRAVVENLTCGERTECIYISSGDNVRLGVDTPRSRELDYNWELANDVDGLLLTGQNRNEISLEVSHELSKIVTTQVTVEPVGANATMPARDTINIVAVPAALAAQVGTLDEESSDFIQSCSGFILRDRDEYFVVTAGHCLDENFLPVSVGDNTNYGVQIGTSTAAPILRGTDIAYDEISDLGVFRIPDPDLVWTPEINSADYPVGDNVTVVGISRTGGFTREIPPQLSVTAGDVLNSELCGNFYRLRDYSVPGYSPRCDYTRITIESSVSSPRGSGSPIVNSEQQVVGVISGGRGGFSGDNPTTVGPFLRGYSNLDPLLMGHSRCLVRELDEERGYFVTMGVNSCEADAEQ